MHAGLEEQLVVPQAGVALPALGIQDPERGGPARRAVSVVGDERLRPLADDVAAESDP